MCPLERGTIPCDQLQEREQSIVEVAGGLMNGAGVIGAMSSQWFIGAFSDQREKAGYTGREQWDPLFDVYVGVLVLGAVAWWSYRDRPLERENPTGESS